MTKDSNWAAYWMETHQNSMRSIFKMKMDDSSFDSQEESMKKTSNSVNEAYFINVNTIATFPEYRCKV